MKSRPLLLGLALAAGLGCAVVLWQVWRAESENSVAAAGAPAAVATPNKDAATPTTDLVSGQTAALSAEARALLAAGYRFVVRYVRRTARHRYDITAEEADVILSAGLGLMLVQHVAPDGMNSAEQFVEIKDFRFDGNDGQVCNSGHHMGLARGRSCQNRSVRRRNRCATRKVALVTFEVSSTGWRPLQRSMRRCGTCRG